MNSTISEDKLAWMSNLETSLAGQCRQINQPGMVDLPWVALSGGPHSALVAAALNRRMPLHSLTYYLPWESAQDEIPAQVEFLGTTHLDIFLTPEELVGFGEKSILEALKERLAIDHIFTGADIPAELSASLTDEDLVELKELFVPCHG